MNDPPPETTGQAFRQFQYLTVPLHGDLTIKQAALDRTTPPDIPPGRYQPPDSLLAFLEAL